MIRRFTPMVFPHHCPKPFKTLLSAPFRFGKCPYSAARYAIEYDYVDPRALLPSLELKAMPALFGSN